MPFYNGFRGSIGGAVQTEYNDQPAVAVAGMLAFASDINMCDALFIGEDDGIAAGLGVKVSELTDAISLQRPNQAVVLPEAGDVKGDFAGIVVYDEAMQSDENGVPGWAKGRVARVVRPVRAGGRVYVKAVEAIEVGDTVNWVIVAGTDELYAAGEFAPAALAGTATAGTSVALDNARWVTGAAAGEVAMIEFT